MKVIITGATGMVGHGVLLECLDDKRITSVLVVNRRPLGITHKKLKEIIHEDFFDLSKISKQLKGYDACFFCLGTSAFRKSEELYTKLTFELTTTFAHSIVNNKMTLCYITGAGTDSSEKGRIMWARVKGKTENALFNMGFKDAYMFRAGYIQPMRGVKSSTRLYDLIYRFCVPLYPFFKKFASNYVTSSVEVGKAMINAACIGYDKKKLENKEINHLATLA